MTAFHTATLPEIYSPGHFVSSPGNRVAAVNKFYKKLMSGVISTTHYTNCVEKIIIEGNTVSVNA
jgi:hypothetical protein